MNTNRATFTSPKIKYSSASKKDIITEANPSEKKNDPHLQKKKGGQGAHTEASGRVGHGADGCTSSRSTRTPDTEIGNMTPDPDKRPLSSLNSSGSTPGALYGAPCSPSKRSHLSKQHTRHSRWHTYPRYGERHDFQTYINLNYLLATWLTALAAVYNKLMAQPCSTRIPEYALDQNLTLICSVIACSEY